MSNARPIAVKLAPRVGTGSAAMMKQISARTRRSERESVGMKGAFLIRDQSARMFQLRGSAGRQSLKGMVLGPYSLGSVLSKKRWRCPTELKSELALSTLQAGSSGEGRVAILPVSRQAVAPSARSSPTMSSSGEKGFVR